MTEPTSSPHPARLAELTWPEVAEARSRSPLAIVPTGSCEQHGPHMALATDTVRGEQVAWRVAEKLAPRAVVTPCLNIGVSSHHMAFPGTLTLSPETFGQALYEVVASLYEHGWRVVYVLNGHGGNTPATGVAVSRLQRDLPDLTIAYGGITSVVGDLRSELARSPAASHASEIETSQTLYLAPHLVREDLLRADRQPGRRYARVVAPPGAVASLPFHLISDDGATGDPSAASREAGQRLVDTAVERTAAFLDDLLRHQQRHSDRGVDRDRRPGSADGRAS